MLPIFRAFGFFGACCFVALLTAPRVAAAGFAVIDDGGAERADARFPRESSLVLTRSRIAVRCSSEHEGVLCRVVERATVENPSDARVTVLVGTHGTLTVDGLAAAALTLALVDRRALACAVDALEHRHGVGACPPDAEWTERTARVEVPAHGRVELVERWQDAEPGERPEGLHALEGGYDALSVRHAWLAIGFDEPEYLRVALRTAPGRTLRGVPESEVVASMPRAWAAGSMFTPLDSVREGDRRVVRFQLSREGEAARFLAALPTSMEGIDPSEFSSRLEVLEEQCHERPIDVARPSSGLLAHGGPYVALGARAEHDVESRVRLRAGYEFAMFFSGLLGSLAADLDFDGRLSVSPAVELAAPFVPAALLMPSFSVGVGAVLNLLPEARAGLRLLFGAHYPLLGVVVAWDLFPATADLPADTQWTVLARVSL